MPSFFTSENKSLNQKVFEIIIQSISNLLIIAILGALLTNYIEDWIDTKVTQNSLRTAQREEIIEGIVLTKSFFEPEFDCARNKAKLVQPDCVNKLKKFRNSLKTKSMLIMALNGRLSDDPFFKLRNSLFLFFSAYENDDVPADQIETLLDDAADTIKKLAKVFQ